MAYGKITCGVCKSEFDLVYAHRYTAREETRTGVASITGGIEPALFDAFDCPYCGCQNIVGSRKRVMRENEEPEEYGEQEEEQEEDEA